jgi:hypothetical protein
MVITMIFVTIVPSFPESFAQWQLDTSIYWAESFGAPEEAVDKIKDDFDADEVVDRFSFTGLLLSFGFVLIFYAIAATLAALVVRKKEPETF